MSGMDMDDMTPTYNDRNISLEEFRSLGKRLLTLENRNKFLEEDVAYWKSRADTLDKYYKSLGSKNVSEGVCTDKPHEEAKVTQDKVEDLEDYKLIAEKVKAENGVLREEIERLHETMRFIQVLSRPDSQSKTPKVTGSIQ